MPLLLTAQDWKDLFPRAPQAIIDAFAAHPAPLDAVGITATRTRLAYALANVEHECGGFTIKNLTENINYSAKRMAQVWPHRFASEAAVAARFGSGPGWQLRAFDEIYGNRMGNRPGTQDGSTYIGRGGPQITGRDGYREVGARARLDLENNPALATLPEHQPALLAAFVDWKRLNGLADMGNFNAYVRAWNGGLIGIDDRISAKTGNAAIIARLRNADGMLMRLREPA